MSKDERDQLVNRMGEDLGTVMKALAEDAPQIARDWFTRFMVGVGLLAMEIDELRVEKMGN